MQGSVRVVLLRTNRKTYSHSLKKYKLSLVNLDQLEFTTPDNLQIPCSSLYNMIACIFLRYRNSLCSWGLLIGRVLLRSWTRPLKAST